LIPPSPKTAVRATSYVPIAPGVIGKIFAMFPRATARKIRDIMYVVEVLTPTVGKDLRTKKQVNISTPHIRREDVVTAKNALGRTATTLSWWRKVDAKSFIFPESPLWDFSIFNMFLVWPSRNDTIKRIEKNSTTAIPDNFIR
jgi:hypothetical protein